MKYTTIVHAVVALLPSLVSATLQCYNVAGTALEDTYAPCDTNATVSSCCELNRANPDVCLGNGLCLSVRNDYAGTIWGTGCTDQSGNDDACPQICAGKVENSDYWSVMQCPKQGVWCCRAFGDWTSCCDDTSRIVDLKAADVTPMSSSVSGSNGTVDITTSDSNSSNAGLVGGVVGGVLGAIAAALLVVAVLLWRQNKRLKKDAKLFGGSAYPATQYSQTPIEQKPYNPPYHITSPVEADGTPTQYSSELPSTR